MLTAPLSILCATTCSSVATRYRSASAASSPPSAPAREGGSTGGRCRAWGDTGNDLASRIDRGFWLEQAVFQSLQSWRSLDPAGRRLYFWRDRAGHEVDFVLEKDGRLVALEIKASQQVTPADGDGIIAFRQGLGTGSRFQRGVVLHVGAARPLGQGLLALPWGWLLPKKAV